MDAPPTPARSQRPTGPRSRGRQSESKPVPALALTALVLGILGLVTSVLLVGVFLGLAGLVFGAIHLACRRGARGLAWTGVGLSAAGIVATLAFGVLYLAGARRAMDPMQRGAMANLDAWVGRPAPDFEVMAVDGTPWKLSDFRGRRVVIDCWATWCSPCVQEIPHFIELRAFRPGPTTSS